ncbi:MAG: T9SS type A sorting domain-containing protein [Saprospiraceae bacterium]
MKNQTRLFFIILLFFSFGKKTNAQDCTLPQAQKLLQGNNISANILLGGDLFWDRNDASFNTYPSPLPDVHSIFNTGLWLGGFTGLPDNPILKSAHSDYNSSTSFDFSAGPLSSENGTVDFETCANYDRLWEVLGSEIEQHITDFNDNGIIDNQISNIYSYPGHQNPYFENNNGFTLPLNIQEFAPFWDNDNDGIYNPDQGDYPLPSAVHKDHYPDHLIWGVFNDAGANHTSSSGDAIRAEIQVTAWASFCTDNVIINNTVFTSHKIINRAQDQIDSLFSGTFVDFDLGCYTDDYVGSIPSMNTFYAYNSSPSDGNNGICQGGINTYADNPPVQAVTYLNQNLNSFSTTTPPNTTTNFFTPAEIYNLLAGIWADGTPFTLGGTGYNSGGAETSFLFDGNPNTANDWSMLTANITDADFRTISSIEIGSLNQNESTTIDMAYTFYVDGSLDNIESVNMIYDNTPLLQQMYDDKFESTCTSIVLSNEDLTEYNIQVYPNPTSDILNIKIENSLQANFSIFDMYGKRVLEKMEVNRNEIQLSTSNFSSGVYFLKIEMDGKEFVKKFIKI